MKKTSEPVKTNIQLQARAELARRELARRKLIKFVKYTFPKYSLTPFHENFIRVVQAFAEGRLKKLMISVPPQHGKTEVATRRLVAFLLGQDPSRKVAVTSYSTTRAIRFGNQIKGIMNSPAYNKIFPNTNLPGHRDKDYSNKAEYVDIAIPGEPGDRGNIFFTGRGGGLTGDTVDYLIMDDLYKNSEEANSPVIRQSVVDWFDTVAESRLHNDSQQLIVFTRWHDKDLIGYIKENEKVINIETWEQLETADPDVWHSINFEALKLSAPTEIDPRGEGEPLYPEKHSRKNLEGRRARMTKYSPEKWNSVYMGDPRPVTGLLYGLGFKTYTELPALREKKCYIDVADQGKDFLCAVSYGVGMDNYLYLLDVVYSNLPAESTYDMVIEMLIRNRIQIADFESNSAGYAYARDIRRLLLERFWEFTHIETFHQGSQKEARLVSQAPEIMRLLLMPDGWINKYPMFAEALNSFRKLFKSNKYDDGPDGLTGAYEKSGLKEHYDPDDGECEVGEWA